MGERQTAGREMGTRNLYGKPEIKASKKYIVFGKVQSRRTAQKQQSNITESLDTDRSAHLSLYF